MFGWLKKLTGRRGGESSRAARRSVRSRVEVESVYQPTTDLLRELRRVDPMLDVFILPEDGMIWLLHMQPDRERIIEARKAIEFARKTDTEEAMFADRLACQGFYRLGEFQPWEVTFPGIFATHARRALNATREEVEAAIAAQLAIADSTMQKIQRFNVLSDRIRSYAKRDHARTFKNAKQFGYGYASR